MNLGRLADREELDVRVVGLAVLAVDKVTKVDQEVDVTHYKNTPKRLKVRTYDEESGVANEINLQKDIPRIMS